MKKDNVELICSVAELSGLFEKSRSLGDFLQSVVSTVAYHMKAAVCSIYLLEDGTDDLVLRANQGLSAQAVGRLRMKSGEGITGLALKELRPIREARGSQHRNFKFVPGINEEKYEAFLAVPILKGLDRIGVLVVQDTQPAYFDDNDTRALQAIAAQLATVIENATLLMDLHQREAEKHQREREKLKQASCLIRGTAASEGYAYGRITVLDVATELAQAEQEAAGRSVTEADFLRAFSETERQLKLLQEQTEETLSDVAALIFSAHLLILSDAKFSGAMIEQIRSGIHPVRAICGVTQSYVSLFSQSKNLKLREKIYDVKDLGHRLLHNLVRRVESEAEYKGEVVVTDELFPSVILKLATQGVEGIVLIGGSVNSHVSILARSLRVPMVIVEDRRLLQCAGTMVQLDALRGTLFVNPDREVVESFQRLADARRLADESGAGVAAESHTLDGQRVTVLANINLLGDLEEARRMHAEGIGLYRSEFPFIVRNDFPSEEEQHRIYRTLVEGMAGRPVVMRTLDIGGDKLLSYFPSVNEANPFLGLRAIRFSLRNRHIFSQQLRAMLRAGYQADLGILFPLISSVDDFVQAREVVEACARELEAEGIAHNSRPLLGPMIELPSAVEVVDELAREADFLSVGSNDLVQYILAVDRTSEVVSDLYLSHHPAVLRALRKVADACVRHGKPLSLCGDMATDEALLPFLLGIGFRRFSVQARRIPRLQRALAGIHSLRAREGAERMLAMGRVSEVSSYLEAQTAPAGAA